MRQFYLLQIVLILSGEDFKSGESELQRDELVNRLFLFLVSLLKLVMRDVLSRRWREWSAIRSVFRSFPDRRRGSVTEIWQFLGKEDFGLNLVL